MPANRFAVTGLVMGILGVVLIPFMVVHWDVPRGVQADHRWAAGMFLTAVLGIIFGAIGMVTTKPRSNGKRMAIAGLVCGIVGTSLGLLAILAVEMFGGIANA
jgi:hypothetical protein